MSIENIKIGMKMVMMKTIEHTPLKKGDVVAVGDSAATWIRCDFAENPNGSSWYFSENLSFFGKESIGPVLSPYILHLFQEDI